MTLAQSGTAVTNTVPGGSGIGVGLAYAMLDSWGFSRARSTLAVLVTGVWNAFIKLALPVLALALIALQGDASRSRVAAGAAAIVLLGVAIGGFGLVLRSDRAAARVGDLAERAVNRGRRLVRRPPAQGWARATTRFRSRARDLLAARWPVITGTALLSHLSLYLVLLVALRHVGVGDAEVGWAQVLFVFACARLLTAIRFTPGGAGVVEAVLIGGLVAFGGDPAQVTASVLVFRALTWLLPVPLGALTYLGWRWQQHRRAAPAAPRDRDRRAPDPVTMSGMPTPPTPPSGWPLVLAGPMPRRLVHSLWFDKTSIRAGAEPERLPYTVYDLPLAPPPAGGQAARVR